MPKIRADGIAVYVYRRRNSKLEFLQLRRSDHTGEYQHSWQIVYGGIKKKEHTVAAALRELKEETNLRPKFMFQVEFLETFYFRPHDYVLVMPVFAAEVSADATIKLNKEHSDYRWTPEKQIPKKFMWRTQREALSIILDTLHHGSVALKELHINLKDFE